MARRQNPYYTAPSGNYDAIGQGVTNLASVFMNTPNAADTAKSEALAWQARGARQEQEQAGLDRQERGRLANLFELHDPETYDPRQVMATGIRSGLDGDELANLFLTSAGNLEGMSDAQRAGALVGTGRTLGENDAVSLDHQTQLRRDNQAADVSELNRDGLIANIFQTEGPEAAARARDSMYSQPQPRQDQNWLNMSRKAEIEKALAGEISALPMDLGLEDGTPVPPELRGYITQNAMNLVETQGLAPRTAVAQVLSQVNARAEGTSWFDGDPRVEYALPDARRPGPGNGESPVGLPSVGERVPGKVYDTPRGPMQWVDDPTSGQTGWLPVQG